MIKFGTAVDFLLQHKKGLILGAAAAGAYSAHPLKKSGVLPMMQEEVLGAPDAISQVVRAQVATNLREMFYTGGENRAFDYLSNNYRAGPPPINSGPSGNVVFGLYNLRR